MPSVYTTQRRVEFRETDAAGIAHFSAFFGFMEEAEHALLRSLGTSVMARDSEGVVSWPRVSASCDFSGAAQFEEVLDVEVRVRRLGEKSVTYAFRFLREGSEIAAGEMVSVCCRLKEDAPPAPVPIPEVIRAKLAPYAE